MASGSLRAYQRRTGRDALMPGLSLGTNPAVRRALNASSPGGRQDVVSRVWRKAKGDWTPGTRVRSQEPIVRLILDGTVARSAR